jgi:cystathionine beta-lyase/cystathionine gamma-synthase
MKREAPQAKQPQGASTRAVHAGAPAPISGEPVVTPIAQTTTFFNDPAPAGEVLYTRYGTNPNHSAVNAKLAALEGAEAAIVVGSGMAASALALLAHVRAGDHIVAANSLYGGTLALLQKDLPQLDIQTTFAEPRDFEGALRPNTRALFIEMPVNPTLRVPDLRPLGVIARSRDIPLFVDATFATPINFRPLEHGATVVIHSATKYLGGHSDVTAGGVVGSADMVESVREKMKSFGAVLDPHAAWLLERGMKTLALRMQRHNETAFALARWLEMHSAVEKVHYPGLESHADHMFAKQLFSGYGGMLSLVVRGGDDAAMRVIERFELIAVAPSLGGVESLASMPRFTSHASLTPGERHALGIDDGFIRLSIGIEDYEDLRYELQHALGAAA